MKEKFLYWIIIIILGIFLGNYILNPNIVEVDKIVNTTDTLIKYRVDTIYPEPVTKYITKEVPKIVYVQVNDSLRAYSDTTYNDDVEIIISDTIKGSLEYRKVEFELYIPREIKIYEDRIITNTETKFLVPKNQHYLIGSIGYDPVSNTRYYGAEYLKTYNRFTFGVGANTRFQLEGKIGYRIK